MKTVLTCAISLTLAILLPGCTESNSGPEAGHAHGADTHDHGEEDTHVHADGSTHANHAEDEHDHNEVPLPSAVIGDMTVELGQGHGKVEAGKESHLVVKLPYNDNGTSIVRAWVGTEDRTLSYVGKGEYAPSHDDYDIHVMTPDPLPENTMWWIEIERPDGTKLVGSTQPIM